MESGGFSLRPPMFKGTDWDYWKHRMRVYIEAQGIGVWKIIERDFAKPAEVSQVTPLNSLDVENNSRAMNILFAGLERDEYDRVSHLDTAHKIWQTLITYHEGSEQIKIARADQFKVEYNRFEQKPGESIKDLFSRFEKIVNKLRSVGVNYTDSEIARHLLNTLEPAYDVRKIAIQESANLSTLSLDLLFSKLTTHEITAESRHYQKNNSLALFGENDMSTPVSDKLTKVNLENSSSASSMLCLSLAALSTFTDEQLETLPEEDLALFSKRFTRAYHNVRKKRRKGAEITCYGCGEKGHYKSECFQAQEDKGSHVKFQGRKKSYSDPVKKTRQAARSLRQALAAVEAFNSSGEEYTSSEEESCSPKIKKKNKKAEHGFTGMCFMAHSSDDIKENSETDEVQICWIYSSTQL